MILYPTNGAVNADLSQPIQWTSVAHVQAYYLYVGTTRGAKDLVDTGEMLQTSYLVAQLPAGQTVYARLWTKAGGLAVYRQQLQRSPQYVSPPAGQTHLSRKRGGECGLVAADPVDERGECAGVLSVCRDDPRRQGSRGYGRDAADVVSGGAATSRADCLCSNMDEGRGRLAVHRQQLQRPRCCRPDSPIP